jgi:hypothetical protein
MMKTKLAIAVLAVTGLIGSPLVAEAKTHMKHPKAHSTTTTGANMKSSGGTSGGMSGSTSTQGKVAPKTGTQQSGKY